jgi:BirA family transcriptional regulator, biotin operon repressor / biotin---[acetyl-CoA-carboxylase] ligase
VTDAVCPPNRLSDIFALAPYDRYRDVGSVNFRVIRHDLIDSTSERAFAEITAGTARHGDVHLARGQTAGRGRRGRPWVSAPGEGLFLSVVLLPALPPLKPTALTMATALAVREAVIDLGLPADGDGAPRLKWPNDVLVGDAKLCGILTESRGQGARPPHFVVGIGVNVAQHAFPASLEGERPVTSLALLGVDIGVETTAEALLAHLRQRLPETRDRHRRLATDFLLATGLAGRPVRIRSGGEESTGTILGLTLSDGLEVRTPEGETEHLPLEFVQSVEPL